MMIPAAMNFNKPVENLVRDNWIYLTWVIRCPTFITTTCNIIQNPPIWDYFEPHYLRISSFKWVDFLIYTNITNHNNYENSSETMMNFFPF